jgi:hypothetical protein
MSFDFDRSEYRLPYPPTARAILRMGKLELPLIDCSERGLRYLAPAGEMPEVGLRIEGSVKLLSGGPAHEIEGTVVRCHSGEVAVNLDRPGIPVSAMFAEQRFLSRRFPLRFEKPSGH